MKTARTEEIESLEEMSDLVQVAIEGKKEKIHQQAMQVKKEKMERRNKLKSQIQGTSRASTETTQSFLLIPDSPKAAQLRAEHLSQISQTSRRAEPKPPVSQPIFTEEDELDLSQQCYCGLQVVSYICRQKGLNYGRRFLRCPQTPGSHAQCHYFIWTEPPKNQQYEAMSHSATSPSKLGSGIWTPIGQESQIQSKAQEKGIKEALLQQLQQRCRDSRSPRSCRFQHKPWAFLSACVEPPRNKSTPRTEDMQAMWSSTGPCVQDRRDHTLQSGSQ